MCSVEFCSYRVRKGRVAVGKGVMTPDMEKKQCKWNHPRDRDF